MYTYKSHAELLKGIGKFGKIIDVFEIENYQIIKIQSYSFDNQVKNILTDEIRYTGFVNGKEVNELFDSLDLCLAALVSVNHGTYNSDFARGFLRMVKNND